MNPQFNYIKEKYIVLFNLIEEHIFGGKQRWVQELIAINQFKN
jgi:hypothetical protein